MSENNINEDLREACSVGDEDRIKALINMGAQINSRNPTNGMTCLHWAASRNNRSIVKLCLEYGADSALSRHDGKLPAHLTTDSNIRNSLGLLSPTEPEANNDIPTFIPNYLKNPVFPYTQTPQSQIPSQIDNDNTTVLVKMKISGDQDFIEVDLEKFTTFDNFKQEIKKEFNLNSDIKLIRKLPNVLVRDERDVLRLKEGNELEIELIQ